MLEQFLGKELGSTINVGQDLCNETAHRLAYALMVVVSHFAVARCNEAAKSHAVYDRMYTAAVPRPITSYCQRESPIGGGTYYC